MMILWTNDPLIKRNMWVGCLDGESYGEKAQVEAIAALMSFGWGGARLLLHRRRLVDRYLDPRAVGE
jgi:hypothetical protein